MGGASTGGGGETRGGGDKGTGNFAGEIGVDNAVGRAGSVASSAGGITGGCLGPAENCGGEGEMGGGGGEGDMGGGGGEG